MKTGLLSLLYLSVALVVAHHLAITVLCVIREWLRRREPRRAPVNDGCRVAVIVPAFNEARNIEAVLHALAASTQPLGSVVVVDDGSSDDTAARAATALRRLADGRVIRHRTNLGKVAALNAALAAVSDDLVFTLDADTVVEPTTIARAVRTLLEADLASVACNIKALSPSAALGRLQAIEYVGLLTQERRAFDLFKMITTVPGAAGLWRRAVVLEAGGFRDRTLAEDTDLSLTVLRAGRSTGLAEDAVAWTTVPPTLGEFLGQRERWYWGNLRCAFEHAREVRLGRSPAFALALMPFFFFINVLSLPLYVGSLACAVSLGLYGAPVPALVGGACVLGAAHARVVTGILVDGGDWPRTPLIPATLIAVPPLVCLAAAIGLLRRSLGWRRSW